MMNGIFVKQTFLVVIHILAIVLFGFVMAVELFLMIVDGITFPQLVCVCIACVFIAYSISALYFNRGAYFFLSEEGVSSRFSWNTELKCSYSEICFCECRLQSLTIRLKNGKTYLVQGLSNAADLCREIRKRIQDENSDSLTELYRQIHSIQKRRIQWLVGAFLCIFITFLSIILAVIFTNGKDLSDFTQDDWIAFGVFGALSLVSIVLAFFCANKGGKRKLALSEKRNELKQQILKTAPVPAGNLLGLYLDVNDTQRVLVFGCPDTEGVFFLVQSINESFDVITTYSSPLHSNLDELQPMLDNLIQIV